MDRVYSSEREGILSWLSAIDRNLQLRTISKRRVEGTGDFLFRTPQFNSWLETSGQSIFCPGSAGAGKTVLASLVIAQLQTIFRGDVKVGIIYFFSGFGRPEKLDPSKLLSSFLKQLVEEQLSVPKDVIGLFKEHFKKITKPSYTKLAKVFHSVASKYSRIFVILDNTDEPEVSVRQRALIYREINYLREEVALNLFTTSTFSPEMIGELKNNLMLEVRAPQEDIERYLDEMIKILPLVVSSNIVLMEDYKKNIVNAANRVLVHHRSNVRSIVNYCLAFSLHDSILIH